MTTVHKSQSLVACAFGTILDHDPGRKRSQTVEKPLRHAVGTSPYNQPDNPVDSQGFLIKPHQAVDVIGMSIRVGLKVGQIFHFRIFAGKESLTLGQLCGNT